MCECVFKEKANWRRSKHCKYNLKFANNRYQLIIYKKNIIFFYEEEVKRLNDEYEDEDDVDVNVEEGRSDLTVTWLIIFRYLGEDLFFFFFYFFLLSFISSVCFFLLQFTFHRYYLFKVLKLLHGRYLFKLYFIFFK